MDEVSLLFVLLMILAVFGTAAWASFRAAPFVPLRRADVERMIALANLRHGDVLCDLGCGDGRVLFAAVRAARVRALGYELSLLPFLIATVRRWLSPDRVSVSIRFKDFFTASFRTPDVFVCFLTPMAMAKLAPKFAREAKAGARILSYAFPLPGWTPVVSDKPGPRLGRIFVYRVDPGRPSR